MRYNSPTPWELIFSGQGGTSVIMYQVDLVVPVGGRNDNGVFGRTFSIDIPWCATGQQKPVGTTGILVESHGIVLHRSPEQFTNRIPTLNGS